MASATASPPCPALWRLVTTTTTTALALTVVGWRWEAAPKRAHGAPQLPQLSPS